MPEPRFHNRLAAGRLLGAAVAERYKGRPNVLVLGLPRGGVPVAHEVAAALGAPLDVFIVRKLGVPGHEELAMGAIASGGVRVLNRDVLDYVPVSDKAIEAVAVREQRELERRGRPFPRGQAALARRGEGGILVHSALGT